MVHVSKCGSSRIGTTLQRSFTQPSSLSWLFCFDVRDILPLDLDLLPHDLAFPRPKHRTFLHQRSTSPCEQVANVSCLGVNEALHG
jgi:hypothetical protein